MKVQSSEDVARLPVEMEGAVGCSVRWLVSREDGAPNFAMRQFEIEPGGYTPHHHHPYEHEVYVLEGAGEVLDGETPRPISAGDVILVQPDDVHQFRNTGDKPMKFLCLIPNSADNRPGVAGPECSAVESRQ
ncbi:MAG: cupin domain-containing protein [Planctomycetota bacterium]|nr:MAG: cupin domain-containing protein [Planctomycetota bacterium]